MVVPIMLILKRFAKIHNYLNLRLNDLRFTIYFFVPSCFRKGDRKGSPLPFVLSCLRAFVQKELCNFSLSPQILILIRRISRISFEESAEMGRRTETQCFADVFQIHIGRFK